MLKDIKSSLLLLTILRKWTLNYYNTTDMLIDCDKEFEEQFGKKNNLIWLRVKNDTTADQQVTLFDLTKPALKTYTWSFPLSTITYSTVTPFNRQITLVVNGTTPPIVSTGLLSTTPAEYVARLNQVGVGIFSTYTIGSTVYFTAQSATNIFGAMVLAFSGATPPPNLFPVSAVTIGGLTMFGSSVTVETPSTISYNELLNSSRGSAYKITQLRMMASSVDQLTQSIAIEYKQAEGNINDTLRPVLVDPFQSNTTASTTMKLGKTLIIDGNTVIKDYNVLAGQNAVFVMEFSESNAMNPEPTEPGNIFESEQGDKDIVMPGERTVNHWLLDE